jgi:hypothetical protein
MLEICPVYKYNETVDILNIYFTKDKDIVTRNIAGETIIVPVRSNVGDLNSIYTLNEVGTTIWELIDGKKDVKKIIEMIYSEYEISAEEAERDVIEFIEQLKEAEMIREV